jgi:hypothetical protein
MPDSTPFPPLPLPQPPALTRLDMVAYLLRCKEENATLAVYKGDTEDDFCVVIDEERKLLIRGNCTGYTVGAERLGVLSTFGNAQTTGQLEQLVATAAGNAGSPLPAKPTRARLSASKPASNAATLSGLIGSSEVQAIFDPYLDNRALCVLLDILSFGAAVSSNLRLLACKKQAQGSIPRLTKTFVADWFKERGIAAGETRLMADGEHRRFILLSGGQSLLLGMSLNSIAKNEAIRLEPDVEDRRHFDTIWAAATAL